MDSIPSCPYRTFTVCKSCVSMPPPDSRSGFLPLSSILKQFNSVRYKSLNLVNGETIDSDCLSTFPHVTRDIFRCIFLLFFFSFCCRLATTTTTTTNCPKEIRRHSPTDSLPLSLRPRCSEKIKLFYKDRQNVPIVLNLLPLKGY